MRPIHQAAHPKHEKGDSRQGAAQSKFVSLFAPDLWLCQRCFLNLAVSNTGGAHTNALARAFYHCVYRLKVQVPATLRHIVCVTDTISELRSTTAEFTYFCHTKKLPPGQRRAGKHLG